MHRTVNPAMKSRKYEEKLREVYLADKKPLFSIAAGKIPGEMHLSAGQEPSAAWMSALLREDDFVYSTHRPKDQVKELLEKDPIKLMGADLINKIILPEQSRHPGS